MMQPRWGARAAKTTRERNPKIKALCLGCIDNALVYVHGAAAFVRVLVADEDEVDLVPRSEARVI